MFIRGNCYIGDRALRMLLLDGIQEYLQYLKILYTCLLECRCSNATELIYSGVAMLLS